ncbi:hypothetical protein V8E36_002126 [Tilletia maclaganii]
MKAILLIMSIAAIATSTAFAKSMTCPTFKKPGLADPTYKQCSSYCKLRTYWTRDLPSYEPVQLGRWSPYKSVHLQLHVSLSAERPTIADCLHISLEQGTIVPNIRFSASPRHWGLNSPSCICLCTMKYLEALQYRIVRVPERVLDWLRRVRSMVRSRATAHMPPL